MKKKSKIFLTITVLVIFSLLMWFFLGSLSPITAIRKKHFSPKELISLQQAVPSEQETIYLTAHRGVNAQAPENTLPAYQKAIELGYYSAECDIKQTKDGTWVLYHDPFLFSRFHKFGNVASKDLETLRSYPYKSGSAFWEYPELRIPTLEEYLDLFVGAKTRPQIEIKTGRYDSLDSVVKLIKEKGLEKTAIIISFDYEQLQELRRLDSEIELWYLVYHINQKSIDKAKALGNCWISADLKLNNEKSISRCLEQNVGLSLWTVNSTEKAQELYNIGVRYMETDILY